MTFNIDDLYELDPNCLCGDWPVKPGCRITGINHASSTWDGWGKVWRVVTAPVDHDNPEDEATRRKRVNNNTIVGSGRVKFTKPGEKYHWVRDTEWERQWEAEGLLPKRWAAASEPVVISTYRTGVIGDESIG